MLNCIAKILKMKEQPTWFLTNLVNNISFELTHFQWIMFLERLIIVLIDYMLSIWCPPGDTKW